MINVARTSIPTLPVKSLWFSLCVVYGLGLTRTHKMVVKISGREDVKVNLVHLIHFWWLNHEVIKQNYLLKDELYALKLNNVRRLKRIQHFHGQRLLNYLPARGQRTRSNGLTARYLGSGTYFFVAKRPSKLLKKMSRYARRKKPYAMRSERFFRKLTTKQMSIYAKENAKTVRYLSKKQEMRKLRQQKLKQQGKKK